ncbi:OmpA family protein [Chitinophaga lutea]|uniref:OmpA family protein n=1 Tax=Chitinophaga lutea TaxID=2488634 RepID=A0A3N4PKG0_9BACT|nr:OmpA family protein [Chitinophaga lutea]RPE09163.1 OmpA family protein [Chitinophaga lutea]
MTKLPIKAAIMINLKFIFCICTLTYCTQAALCQNLVVNGDFNRANLCELNSPCSPKGWYTSYDIDWAYQRIHNFGVDGTHCIFVSVGGIYFNYWQSELMAPLSKDHTYKLDYYIKNVQGVTDINAIQVGFTSSRTHLLGTKQLPIGRIIDYKTARSRKKKEGWIKMSIQFQADGSEKWIIIGRSADRGSVETDSNRYLYALDELTLTSVREMALDENFIQQRTMELTSNRKRHELGNKSEKSQSASLNGGFSDTIKYAKSLSITDTIRISNILFDVDSFKLKVNGDLFILDSLARVLRSQRFVRIFVNGHTDDSGGDEYNLSLSVKRADVVREYLIRAGLPADRIEAKGYGSRMPLNENTSEHGRIKNRRVEILILRE